MVICLRGAPSGFTLPARCLRSCQLLLASRSRSYLSKGLHKSGTGFFVTETGVIATNAHVARDEESLLAALPDGLPLEAKVVYVDADLASRCLKLQATNFLI